MAACTAQDASPTTPSSATPRPTYNTNQVTDPDAEQDEFGIQNLYPSLEQGNYWVSNWQDGNRTFVKDDPADSWFDTNAGTAAYEVEDGHSRSPAPLPGCMSTTQP